MWLLIEMNVILAQLCPDGTNSFLKLFPQPDQLFFLLNSLSFQAIYLKNSG